MEVKYKTLTELVLEALGKVQIVAVEPTKKRSRKSKKEIKNVSKTKRKVRVPKL